MPKPAERGYNGPDRENADAMNKALKRPSWPEPSRVFSILAPILGLLFLALTPPFQVPDEPEHFYRAYQLSEGGIRGRAERDGGMPRAGGVLPKSLKSVAESAMGDIAHNESVKANLAEIRRALAMPLAPHDRSFLDFPTTVLYSPVPYLPQAAAAAAGRLVKAHPLALLYLMRLANLLAWLLLAGAAIKTTPVFQWVFMLLALAPMSLAQAASASADAVTNGAAFLFIALVLRAALGGAPAANRRARLSIVALAVSISLCKPVYAILPLFVFIIPAARLGGPKGKELSLSSRSWWPGD